MTENISLHLDTTGLSQGLGEASAEISRVAREEIAPAASLIEDAFSSLANAIERDLKRAARSGSLSLKGLANSILHDLKRVALDSLVRKPIENLLLGAFGGGNFGGGRASGGFVARGNSYLVGERGPEVFTPSVSGRIQKQHSAPVTVNISLPGVADARSFRESETQLAAGLMRVLARGQRNL